ncbi:hypothetical protein GB2207_06004 [marine gamma proteobacterium HTCC2207]|uniref:Glycosyltransferase n=1 Tax=gamma proteobacterium HTCC2207 TaxID=314287 RepID=Q1YPR8_9GAMM|nr:hypothetical protein GB2207_06004 [marine gamma proteobacterium HTCC2207] [gamma proteobacterium HTCC2207]
MVPLIIGRIPEVNNIGGVGIFVSRLLVSSKYLNSIGYTFYSTKKWQLLKLIRVIYQSSFVHFNGSNPAAMFFVALVCKVLDKELILSIHSEVGISKGVLKRLEEYAIKLAHAPVVGIGSEAVAKALNSRTETSSAFIPPIQSDDLFVDSVLKSLSNKKIFCTNANAFNFDSFGREIYGITCLVDYFENQGDYTLVVVDSSGAYTSYYESKNFSNVVFIDRDIDFCYLIQNSFCFVRFTSTDGDAVSVMESLSYGVPVIATDCVLRPDTCILCKYGDTLSLRAAIETLERDGSMTLDVVSASIFYDKLYEKLSKSTSKNLYT